MAMHRRHYQLIARVLKDANGAMSNQAMRDLVARFAEMLATENANFDRDLFAKACGLS